MAGAMRRSRRRKHGASRPSGGAGAPASGSGGWLGQVGLFETANGLPHGPGAIALGILALIVVYPITRLARMMARR